MSIQPKLKELLFASFHFEKYNPQHTKILILNAFLFITASTSIVLLIFNFFTAENTLLCYIDTAILLPTLYSLHLLRHKSNYTLAAYLSIGTLFFAFLSLAVLLEGKHFTLIWSYFFAPFSMIILGAKRGLAVSFLFLVLMLLITYTGIETWMGGYWDYESYVRFTLSQIVMLYVIYAITNSNEQAYAKIESMREREKAQLKLFERLSITDPLTSLYNRRSLKELFPKEFQIAKQEEKQIAYFLLDLDYFKHFNDTYGHQKGDEALVRVADLLRQTSRFSFRIGGDEFAGIVTANKKSAIESLLTRLQEQVQSLEIENKNSPIGEYLTCSIGVHIINGSEYDFYDIYQTADKALYRAKAMGRNCVVFL